MNDRKAARRAAKPVPPPIALNTGWAAAILALLTVLFFHEVLLGGKTFVAPDATAPAGFVRMGEHSLWQDKVYPLWNPYVFLGMPSFGSGTYNPLIYPPDWPLALLQKVVPMPDMTWLLLYYFLGALFMFLLAREWGARAEGALLGAVAFVFAPNLVAVGSHGHGSQLVDSAYLPLMVWLASRWLRRGALADLGWLALAGGFQMLRGHVQICFYTWIAIGLLAGIDWIAALRSPGGLPARTLRVLGLAVAAGLAFGIAGFYDLPLRDYARWSVRGGGAGGGFGMEKATQWSMAPYELPSVLVPGYVGFGDATYWGGMPFTNYPNAYLGMVAVLLALPVFLTPATGGLAPRIFALVLAAFSLLVSFGRHFPLYGFLYDHLPLFNKFRIPVMVILLFQLAAALALAWGWSAVLAGPPQRAAGERRRDPVGLLLLGAAVVLLVTLLAGVLGAGGCEAGYVRNAMTHRVPFSEEAARAAYAGYVGDLGKACALGLVAAGAAWLAWRRRLAPTLASLMVLGLLLVDLLPVSGRVMAPVIGEPTSRNLEAGRDDVVDYLEKVAPAASARILPLAEIQDNRYAGFGIAQVGGYHAAKPQLTQDLFDDSLVTNPFWMRLLNVSYLVIPQALEAPPPFLKQVFRGSQVVYANLMALPRATIVDRYVVVKPARAILDSIREGRLNSEDVTCLETDPGLHLGNKGDARASIVSYRLNDVTVDVESGGPALLRLADLWYPDWSATVDGRPVPILRADYLLRAVPIPAGRHRVVFAYRSAAVRAGMMLSIGSVVVALLMIAAGLLVRRARPSSQEAAWKS
jgi:hypothetical protein